MDICITKRKDGRFMGRFIIDRDESGKAVYQYVYGNTYDDAYKKVQIGMEVELRFQSGSLQSPTVSKNPHLSITATSLKSILFLNLATFPVWI